MYHKNPADVIEKVKLWQRTPFLHPLTCANSSNHSKLEPLQESDSEIVLICPNCGYRQAYIPRGVLMVSEHDLDIIKQQMIKDGFNF